METKYLDYRFSSVKITASCLWTWFTGIHLWIQQTKHLQCSLKSYKLLSMVRSTKNKILLMQQLKVACSHLIYNHFSRKLVLQTRIFFGSTTFLEPEKKSEFAKPLCSTFVEKWLQIKCPSIIGQAKPNSHTFIR